MWILSGNPVMQTLTDCRDREVGAQCLFFSICNNFKCCAHSFTNVESFVEDFLSKVLLTKSFLLVQKNLQNICAVLQLDKWRHKRELKSRVETKIQLPCSKQLGQAFFLSRDHSRPDKAPRFFPLTTNHDELRQAWISAPNCGARSALFKQCWLPAGTAQGPLRQFCITNLIYELDFTRGKYPTYFCKHRGKAVVSMAMFILEELSVHPSCSSLPCIPEMHLSLSLSASSQKEYFNVQGLLPSFCLQDSHGSLGGQRSPWGHVWIFHAQWTIRWWKPQWAWEYRYILTVSSSIFKFHIRIQKHNSLSIQAKILLIQQTQSKVQSVLLQP